MNYFYICFHKSQMLFIYCTPYLQLSSWDQIISVQSRERKAQYRSCLHIGKNMIRLLSKKWDNIILSCNLISKGLLGLDFETFLLQTVKPTTWATQNENCETFLAFSHHLPRCDTIDIQPARLGLRRPVHLPGLSADMKAIQSKKLNSLHIN